VSQTPSPTEAREYQPGTITAVSPHGSADSDHDNPAYDVTIRIQNTEYMILFTPPNGSTRVKFAKGQTVLVKVGSAKLAFRDVLGREFESPIVGSKAISSPPRKDIF
jgi:hypothetical protein